MKRKISGLGHLPAGALVWDNHACMPLDPDDLAQMASLERVRASGVDVISLNVASGEQTPRQTIGMLAAFRHWISQHPDDYQLVSSMADLEAAKQAGRMAIVFDIEGMTALDGRTDLVGLYYDLGVRWMLSAYNHANAAGGGCLDLVDGGLTAFGHAVVVEMNRVGMVVCASHAGYRTAAELIDASATPVIFSHSNPRAMWDTPRNITDDLMRACAARGGVVGLNGIGPFLGPNDGRLDRLADHLDYALDLIGEDHVGLALDYCFGEEGGLVDYMTGYPDLFPNPACGMQMVAPWRLGELADFLDERGLSSDTLCKVFGGNHLRIARQVWK